MKIFGSDSKNIKKYALCMASDMILDEKLPIIMCVGTDKIVGDSLGPIVGELLTKKYNIKTHVYGTLSNNVNATNILEYSQIISVLNKNQKVIMVDSTLGNISEIGLIKYEKNGIIPETLKNVIKFPLGAYSILGVVNNVGINEINFVRGIKMQTILSLANNIANILNETINLLINAFAKYDDNYNINNKL